MYGNSLQIASCMRQCPDRKRDGTVILLEDQEEFGGDFACNVVKRMVSLTLDGQNKLLSLLGEATVIAVVHSA